MTRPHTIRLRVTAEEGDAYFEAATRCNLTFSEWARKSLAVAASHAGVTIPTVTTPDGTTRAHKEKQNNG